MEDHEDIKLEISAEVGMLLEERGIRREDIQKVIAFAQETGNVYAHGATGRSLAYLMPSNTTYWVEYDREGDGYRVHKAYSHRMEILHGFNMAAKRAETFEWVCVKCEKPLELATVKLRYLDETFGVDLPACPSCQRIIVSEENAVQKMALAEKMLEDK